MVIRIVFWSESLLGQIYLYFYSKYSYDTLIIARSIEGDHPIVDVFTVQCTHNIVASRIPAIKVSQWLYPSM